MRQANQQTNSDEIVSYQQLRSFIGFIGIGLPFAVVIGCYLYGDGNFSWQPSISHYYYSKMHFVFVCTLCVLGGFLITYRGKNNWENWVSNFAGLFAFGIAAFPTTVAEFRTEPGGSPYIMLGKDVTALGGNIHFGFAGLLFTCFVLFCLVFFQKQDREYKTADEQRMFRRRRRIYTFCGWGIVVSMAAIFVFFKLRDSGHDVCPNSTFIFETTSLLCFGTAWLIKGSQVFTRVPVLRGVIKGVGLR